MSRTVSTYTGNEVSLKTYEMSCARIEELVKAIAHSEASHAEDIAALQAEVVAEKIRLARGEYGQICGFCGWETKPEGASWEELEAHIMSCDKHPASALREEVRKLKEEIAKADDTIALLLERNSAHAKTIETANAAIAMKDEALEKISFMGLDVPMQGDAEYFYNSQLRNCISIAANVRSATPSQVSEWEAARMGPLRQQVAQAHEALNFVYGYPALDSRNKIVIQKALSNTQATAEAFVAEEKAKVLEDVRMGFYALAMQARTHQARCGYMDAESRIAAKIVELRNQAKKGEVK